MKMTVQGERRSAGLRVQQRHLVLNMDVNKTILMRDKCTGKDVKDIVNEVLADASWGIVIDGKWQIVVSEPSVHRPSVQDSAGGQEIVSYNEWLSSEFPGSKNKKLRNKNAGIFTDEGEPGATLISHARLLEERLKDPTGAPVALIPAFFELLLRLKRDKRSFTLVFRTFGEDLQSVVAELNLFCEGSHPLYPGKRMDGSDGETDYRIKPEDPDTCGTFYRDDDTVALIMGSWQSPEREKVPSIKFYDNIPGVIVHKGDYQQMYAFLLKKCSKPGAMALRDYFPYWKGKEMSAEGGKLLFYDVCPDAETHFIFFDDNIRYSNAYIVDTKHACPNSKVPFIASLLQSHICRAEPLESILDSDYFVKHVARLENGYERKLLARKRLKRVLRLVRVMTKCSSAFALAAVEVPVLNPDYDAWEGMRPVNKRLSIVAQDDDDR